MLNQTTMISILFIGFVAAILFVYVQQKTSRIEKNIKNVISFIKDIEKRIEGNKQHVHDVNDIHHVQDVPDDQDVQDVQDVQGVSNEFFSMEQNQVEEEEESEEESEEEESEEESEEENQGESTLDDEIINIKFKLSEEEQENYKKQPVAQLRELIVSLNIDVQDVNKLKKKDIIELLENHYASDTKDNNINI
jgi:uncharacterized protein YoxC